MNGLSGYPTAVVGRHPSGDLCRADYTKEKDIFPPA